MEDREQQESNGSSQQQERIEPAVRSRWTPKPEQILILESIFNSGMVNPPKDETVRIRKHLEKFGAVGDANVFYWFQNRRSRSRRRLRQIQAAAAAAGLPADSKMSSPSPGATAAGAIRYDAGPSCTQFSTTTSPPAPLYSSYCGADSSGSSYCGASGGGTDAFSGYADMGGAEMDQSSIYCPSDASNLHYRQGFIVVFINGVATEVPRGPIDTRAMFGEDVMLVHSSGVPIVSDDFGFSSSANAILQHGESYFLVSRPS